MFREACASDMNVDNVLLLERHGVLAVVSDVLVKLVRSVQLTIGCFLLLHHLQGVLGSCACEVDTFVLCSTIERDCDFVSLTRVSKVSW